MNIFNITIVITILTLSKAFVVTERISDLDPIHKLRVFMVFGLLLNTCELSNRIRVFDFFAYFVRQV